MFVEHFDEQNWVFSMYVICTVHGQCSRYVTLSFLALSVLTHPHFQEVRGALFCRKWVWQSSTTVTAGGHTQVHLFRDVITLKVSSTLNSVQVIQMGARMHVRY